MRHASAFLLGQLSVSDKGQDFHEFAVGETAHLTKLPPKQVTEEGKACLESTYSREHEMLKQFSETK